MKTIILLHAENPLLVWWAFGALIVSASLASGEGRLAWPALAAALTGVLAAAGLHGAAEPAVFALILLLAVAARLSLRSAGRARMARADVSRPVVVISPSNRPATALRDEPDRPAEREAEFELAPLRRFGG